MMLYVHHDHLLISLISDRNLPHQNDKHFEMMT